jgi:hypothetical protein
MFTQAVEIAPAMISWLGLLGTAVFHGLCHWAIYGWRGFFAMRS